MNVLTINPRFPLLDSLQTNDQATALNTIFDHDDICSFDAIIVATQEAVSRFVTPIYANVLTFGIQLHATQLRSTYSTIVDRYRSAENSVHLPYLTYSASPTEQARELAVRCNAKLLQVPTDEGASIALDVSQKYVICLEFPSLDEFDAGEY
jgi:hypothetical protein